MRDTAIVMFQYSKKRILVDLEVPLDITADELITGLNCAYSLGISNELMDRSFMVCERPIALIKGKDTLRQIGVCDGSLIRYTQ